MPARQFPSPAVAAPVRLVNYCHYTPIRELDYVDAQRCRSSAGWEQYAIDKLRISRHRDQRFASS